MVKDKGPHVDSNGDHICDTCEYEIPVKHEHTYSDEWSKNETMHWHRATCEHTDLNKDLGEHDFGDDDICDVCGYQKDTPPVNVYTFNFLGYNCSLNNESSYEEGTEVNLTLTVEEGYNTPKIISVIGVDEYTYNPVNKTLSLAINIPALTLCAQ